MSIEIRLSGEQFGFYSEALNKAKVGFNHRGPIIELNHGDYHTIVEVIKASHSKSLNLKTKTITHMERLFNLQAVITRLDELSGFFPVEEAANDEGELNAGEVA